MSNQFKQLSEINNIKENHVWTKEQNIKVLEKVPLPAVLELLSKFEYETRDIKIYNTEPKQKNAKTFFSVPIGKFDCSCFLAMMISCYKHYIEI